MSKGWWQLIATIALALLALLGGGVLYAVLPYGSNLRKIAESQGMCLAGAHAFDSIAAAQMVGRLDLVSFLLTAGGVLLALFAFMGFWMIRREALDEAGKVAREEARRVAQTYANLEENRVGIYIPAQGSSRPRTESATVEGRSHQPQSFDPATVSTAGAVKEGPDQDDERD